jgi:single-stranded DNA-binding protein
MPKYGIEVRIDVKKIDKARIFEGKKGKYLTMTTFIDTDNADEYGNHGFIAHKKEQNEQENPPILGNSKIFWSDSGNVPQAPQQQAPQQPAPQAPNQQPQQAPASFDDFDDDIPF